MKDQMLAVLIDAENMPYKKLKEMLDEVANYGTPTIKRAYGNWASQSLGNWKRTLIEHAITPVQQYANVKSKNASDSTLIIDAMDILYSERVTGFCIVSSDSDFTRLIIRLRESGVFVLGIGQKRSAPMSLINACNKFIYYEMFFTKTYDHIDKNLISFISASIDDISNDEGSVLLSKLGSHILRKRPDFDTRRFGYAKISELITATNAFELIKENNDEGRFVRYSVRKNK